MNKDAIYWVGFMLSCSFHFELAGVLELAVGCAKMGLKNDPIFLNWSHPVPGFNCILEFPCPFNTRVGDVGRLDLGVRGSRKFPIF